MKHLDDHERQVRAANARNLLENDIFKNAVASVEADAYEQLLRADDDKTRRELIDRINAIRGIESQIRSWIMDGKQAARPKLGIA